MMKPEKAMTFAAAKKDPRFLNFSERNKKLVPGNGYRFLIWNLPAVITCPFRTPMCEKKCYAKKAECGARPDVLPSRMRNLDRSRAESFVDDLKFTIESYMARPVYRDAKKVFFRVHESGDFYSVEYTLAWLTVIEWAAPRYKNLQFMAYTKSFEFFLACGYHAGKLKNFNLIASIWADTDPAQAAIAAEMELPIYTAADAETVEKAVKAGTARRCRCSDCKTCQNCMYGRVKTTYCVIH